MNQKLPVIKFTGPVRQLLKSATIEELNYLDRLSREDDFSKLISLITKFREINVYKVFEFVAKDEKELAYYRAGMVGEVAGLKAVIQAIQNARYEIAERRKRK